MAINEPYLVENPCEEMAIYGKIGFQWPDCSGFWAGMDDVCPDYHAESKLKVDQPRFYDHDPDVFLRNVHK